MITIFIENQPYQVEEGQNLLHIALSLGFDLPYFCWHPALHSVGACRQCAVKQFKNEEDTRGKIVMACITPAAPGMRISINDPEARAFRSHVIEFLMVNHPHDCPVCDEGGECHLQDMTVMTGHAKREFRFLKRTHRNQDLGPLVTHEMNRCIACYRCVRFYRNHAGGRDLDVFGAHDHVYFGRQTDGVLENEFSGNLVEVCPTGVFTDKTLQEHYSRKWDLQTAPSVCVHCSIGCNTIPGERYGSLRRIRNRYNPEVNGYFLCDRGRYGYEFVNSPRRVFQPMIKGRKAGGSEAIQELKTLIKDRSKVIGIGSPRASLESNFALRELVGAENFYHGVGNVEFALTSEALKILQQDLLPGASLKDVVESDAALVLGEDVTNVAPLLALTLRQTARNQPLNEALKLKIPFWHDAALREVIQDKRGPLFLATTTATRLESAAQASYQGAPDDLARFGFAVAHFIDPQAPEPPNLPADVLKLASRVAEALVKSENPVVVSGTSSQSAAILQSAANVAKALRQKNRPAKVCFTFSACNSVGLALMGGQALEKALQAAQDGKVETALILENDLFQCAEAFEVSTFVKSIKHSVVIDHFTHSTSEMAHLVFPAATFAESTGTLVNNEGRAQRFLQVFPAQGEVQSSWRWLGQLMESPWQTEDEIIAALVRAMPVFAGIAELTPPATFRIDGCKIAREPHRYSGRTAMHAKINVHEPEPPEDPDSPLAYTMEGIQSGFPSPLITRYWQPGWNSVQALNKFQKETSGILKGTNPGVRLLGVRPSPGAATSNLPNVSPSPNYHSQTPNAFSRRTEEWLIIPLHHIFGSDPLSMLAPRIAQLAPAPYLALNPEDARSLGVAENEVTTASINGTEHSLPVKIVPSLRTGLVGMPMNLSGLPFVKLPVWAKLSKQSRPVPIS